MSADESTIAYSLIDLRYKQLIINELLKKNLFKIPIHLAIGHEALPIALAQYLTKDDLLCLTHRNAHFNLYQDDNFDNILNYYLLDERFLPMGSMNLAPPNSKYLYTSSILGNNFSIACGLALNKIINKLNGIIFAISGDGAIEEGSFWEAIIFGKSNNLPIVFIIENNDFSMASTINERRCQIDILGISNSLGISYQKINGSDFSELSTGFKNLKFPSVIEINLKTFSNHAGPTPGWSSDPKQLDINKNFYVEGDIMDPIFSLKKNIGNSKFNDLLNIIKNKYTRYELS